jgi:hypothetical protein
LLFGTVPTAGTDDPADVEAGSRVSFRDPLDARTRERTRLSGQKYYENNDNRWYSEIGYVFGV